MADVLQFEKKDEKPVEPEVVQAAPEISPQVEEALKRMDDIKERLRAGEIGAIGIAMLTANGHAFYASGDLVHVHFALEVLQDQIKFKMLAPQKSPLIVP